MSNDMSAFDTSLPISRNHANKVYKEKDSRASKKESHDRNTKAAPLDPGNSGNSEREV